MPKKYPVIQAIIRAVGGRPEHLAVRVDRSVATIHNWTNSGVRFAADAFRLEALAREAGLDITARQIVGLDPWGPQEGGPPGRSTPRSSSLRSRAARQSAAPASDHRPAARAAA